MVEMTGERRIPAPRQRVWEALNDPEVLRASIPGCESIEKTGDDSFAARVAVKIGPMSAKFTGKVRLENLDPPHAYTIVGEGQGGAMGFAKGGADVALREGGPAETLLTYAVKAQVGGKMAQLGARLIDATARQMADQFFDRFTRLLTPAAAVAVSGAAAPGMAGATPIPGTDTGPLADRERLAARPVTQHGVPPVAGTRPGEVSPPPAEPFDLKPLRLFFAMEPFGLPMQFWIGAALMLIILILLFVAG
jgi:carbon monoxide dehydrogenase subunit G